MSAAHYLEQYPQLAATLPGRDLPWLNAKRRAALAQFSAGGFPSPREEEWKYTNVTAIEKKRFQPDILAAGTSLVDAAWLAPLYLQDAWVLVLLDGRYSPDHSRLDGLPEGVVLASLSRALEQFPERVEARFGRTLEAERHGFIAFNTAYFTDGVYLDVPAGVVLERPVQILHVSTRADGLAATRSLISLGENSQARLVESYAGLDGQSYLSAAVTEIDLSEGAGLDGYKLQNESDKAYHFGGLYVSQARNARFAHHNLAFGGLLARTEIHADLDTGSECELNGLFLGQGRQHVDNHTLIQHRKPQGVSHETYRGVLADRAHGVFQGRIVVHPDAQKTSAEMSNRNLLLSDDAEIDTKPQLEILADDVKCSHGVTVGQLAQESVFYLESRGVDRESARNMLTFAFANEMVEKISLDSLRAQAQEQLLRLFPQAGIRRDWL
ncbi:Fe-S cluster assembly protein SufD [Methylococcus sp. EFPC2]|uniref:Fe-S cluster assembly protein SufD n=1 Tax=Methylococcus sp. EFPC2 TaxID=2812648 RepID=UPI0035301B4C